MCPPIDLYPERESDLQALYEDGPADREPVSYEDILDAPSVSEADPAELNLSTVRTRAIRRQLM